MKLFRSKTDSAEMPFLDHLEELRWRILWSLLAIVVGSVIGYFVVTRLQVMEWLIRPVQPYLPGGKLMVLNPLDPFFITLQLTLTVGFLLAFPIVAAQVWAFISPALHKREKRAIVPALYLGLILFSAGVALAYYVVLPMTLKFGRGFLTESLYVNYVASAYLSLVVKLLVAFGAVFELPVVVLVLSSLGLITSRFLSDKRRYAVAGAAVMAALLTPGDAITVTIFMMGPIIVLYELSIVLARLMERRRLKAESSEAMGIATAFLLISTLAISPVSGQQQQQQQEKPPPKTQREIVLEKLRSMGKITVRDTSAAADSIRLAAREDSIRQARRSTTPPPTIESDSIMRALFELEGYSATQYKALTARFNADSGILVLTAKPDQKAMVVQGAQSMTADSLLTFDRKRSLACGFGKPLLTGEGAENPVESRQVCYNTQTRIGTAIGATTKITEGASWVVTGDLTTVETDVYGHRTRFTDCTLEYPHYHFAAKQVKVVNGKVLVARDVTLQFGDVPVFWLPFMMQSMERGRASGILMPRFSVNDIVRRNSRYNRRIENVGFYWAVSEHMGAELTLDWFANNWTALNGSLDYKWNDRFIDGRLTYRQFWKTEGGREFTLASGNSWAPDERTQLRADLQYSTSSQFIRDRSYDPRELNRSIDSNAGMNRRFDWGSVSLQASRRQYLSDNKVDMTLPSLGVNLSSITLFPSAGEGRFYNNATWTASAQTRFTSSAIDQTIQPKTPDRADVTGNLNSSFTMGSLSWSQGFDFRKAVAREILPRDTIEGVPEATEERMSWNTGLNFQQRLIGTTTFTPGVSIRGEMGRDSSGRLISAPVRLDLNTSIKADLFGFFPGFGPVERIRHWLSPTFTYNYSPATKPDSGQAKLFGGTAAQEQNRLSIGLSQTFEAKLKQDESQRDTTQGGAAAEDTISSDPDTPRRIQRGRIVKLLSLNSDAIVYDFVSARDGQGLQTTQISNSVNSDFLRGLQLSVTHDLFRTVEGTATGGGTAGNNAQPEREFAPHLSRVSASFSISGSSWLFKALGLGGSGDPAAPPATGSTPTPVPPAADAGVPTDPTKPELGLLGTRNRPQEPQQQQQRGAVGTWNASLNYTLFRPRTSAAGGGEGENQMVTANVTFQPTEMWNVAWNTGYSFSNNQFTDHVLTLTRAMHDWDANFDFIKAQNGNFSFQFRVSLRANPDIKFDYQQRDRDRSIR